MSLSAIALMLLVASLSTSAVWLLVAVIVYLKGPRHD